LGYFDEWWWPREALKQEGFAVPPRSMFKTPIGAALAPPSWRR
jgi:hypothetical protein